MNLADLGITMKVERIAERTDIPTPFGSNHWKIYLRRNGKQATFYFSMGSAYTRQPHLTEVLDSLLLDYRGSEDDFHWFCQDFGYEYDSIEANKIWQACRRNSRKLENLFGDVGIDDLHDIVASALEEDGLPLPQPEETLASRYM